MDHEPEPNHDSRTAAPPAPTSLVRV